MTRSTPRAVRISGTCALLGVALAGLVAALGAMPAVSSAEAAPTGSSAPRPATLTFSGRLTQGGWIRGFAPRGVRSIALDGQDLPLSAQGGEWFAAFDRDAGTSATLTARYADGRVETKQLTVSPRDWNIEHVNIARRSGGPSAAFMKIRRPELEMIGAARAMRTGAQGWRQDFIWPVKGRISGRFGSQRIYRGEPGSYHSGIDISTGTSGTPFVAPADGVVILAAQTPFSLEGNLLMIDHGNGLNSAFLHCSAITVKEGDHVAQGQVIGRIGSSGRATGPHLHWSIKWADARLDPLLFTGPMD